MTGSRSGAAARRESSKHTTPKARVYVATADAARQSLLSRALTKSGEIEVVSTNPTAPFQAEKLAGAEADILLLASCGQLAEDVGVIRAVRTGFPEVGILLLVRSSNQAEFLQFVRAGIHGCLLWDALASELVEAVRTLQMGEVVCPGKLCAALFRHIEREATSFPCARLYQLTGLTRREQQLIPLIAQGQTNKEIANHFCLSEQTVKNHLYRMKHKAGAANRLDIVQVCRDNGFLP